MKRVPVASVWILVAGCCNVSLAQVHACTVLNAEKPAASGKLETARIQDALNTCSPGNAVVLRRSGDKVAFESAPLLIPRGVTLFVDRGVTLYGSRDPRDYDLKPGMCKPFLFAYQAAFSGVEGGGIIDGQGSVWSGKTGCAPDLVQSYESQGFHLTGITLFHAAGAAAAILKTPSPVIHDVIIDAARGTGLLFSNALDAKVSGIWVHVPGVALELKASILGPTTNAGLKDVHIFGGRGISIGDDEYGPVRGITFENLLIDGEKAGANSAFTLHGKTQDLAVNRGCFHGIASPAPAAIAMKSVSTGDCPIPAFASARQSTLTFDTSPMTATGAIQKLIDVLPATGGDVPLQPGTYREVVTIRKPHVHLHGIDPDPAKTVIVYNNGALRHGGTFNSATVFVEADDVTLDHLSIVNDLGAGKGQAVALHVVGDRAIFRNLRLIGAQDTLFAASRYCYGDYGPCVPARQYFADCFIEGNTDFIFGDSKALFERCDLHASTTGQVMYTAQSKHTADQDSFYVFDHCRITGTPRAGPISLGRPWRPYATVVLLNTDIEAPVIAAGWTEWPRFGKPSLPTAFYAEFASTGPGANPAGREQYSHQLTAAEAKRWSASQLLAGNDGWNPASAK